MFKGQVTVIHRRRLISQLILLSSVRVSAYLHGPDSKKIMFMLINTHIVKKGPTDNQISDQHCAAGGEIREHVIFLKN